MKISNETRVGILATFAIVIVILGINFMRGNSLFSRNMNLYAKFKDVGGLSASNPVILYGVKIGQVDQLAFIHEGGNRVEVKFHVYHGVEFPNNSSAKINSDLLGSKTLEIVPGNSTTVARGNDTLAGLIEPSLPEALSKTVSPIKDKVEALVGSMDTVINSLNKIFNAKTIRDLKTAMASIGPTIRNIESTTGTINTFMGSETVRFHNILLNVDKIAQNVSSYNASITKAIDNIAATSDTIRALKFKKTIQDADSAINNLNSLMIQVKDGNGTLSKLIKDDKLYYSLVSATRNFDKLVYDLKTNPNRYFAPLGKKNHKPEPYKADTAK